MIVALYARVSTEKQDELNQLPSLRERARRLGYLVHKEYTDTASGRDGNRPGWLALMEDAKNGRFDAVLVTKLDRVMRSVLHLEYCITELAKYRVYVDCSDLGALDPNTPVGMLAIHIIGAVAEWERGTISERTINALEEKKRQGVTLGRPKIRAVNVELAAKLKLAGHTRAEIAHKLGVRVYDLNNVRDEINAVVEELKKEVD